MYLFNWIKSSIFHLEHLFFNGTLLSEKYLHNCLLNKSNMSIEILELKEALEPHTELVGKLYTDFRPVDNKLRLKHLT